MDDVAAGVALRIVELLPDVAVNLRLVTLFDRDDAELTPQQLLGLFLLDGTPEGTMRTGDFAGRLDVSMPAVTALGDRLVKAGYCERRRGADRRVVYLRLTERGLSLMRRLREELRERMESILEPMDRPAQLGLVEALERVAVFAQAVGDSDG